jgi:hypothetical protein
MMEPQAQRPEHISSFEGGDIGEIYHGGMPEPDIEQDIVDDEEFKHDINYQRGRESLLLQDENKSADKHVSNSDMSSRDEGSMEFEDEFRDKQCGDEDGPYEENFK